MDWEQSIGTEWSPKYPDFGGEKSGDFALQTHPAVDLFPLDDRAA